MNTPTPYVRYRDLPSLGVPYSRVHLGRLIRAGQFPRPIKLSPATIVFKLTEIEMWLAAREAERDAPVAVGDRRAVIDNDSAATLVAAPADDDLTPPPAGGKRRRGRPRLSSREIRHARAA